MKKKLFLTLLTALLLLVAASTALADSPSNDNCTEKAVCTVCESEYGNVPGHNWDEWAENGDGTHTRVCQNDASHTETGDCTWGDCSFLDNTYHERRCGLCKAQDVMYHTGGKATCSSPRICDVCDEHYGSPDNSGVAGHPNPTVELLLPTCLTAGYYRIACDEPGCSAPFTEFIYPARGQHMYAHWDILGDNMHNTDCAVCGEYADVACTLWGMYDGETLLTVCPVCGDFGDTLFEIIFAREDTAVPIGTLLVRGIEVPFEGALYGITIAGVYGGKVVNIHGEVTVTLPIALEGFTLVRVDVVDGIETRTEIPFTLEDGQLTFSTEEAGLFLLVPAE